MKVKEVQTKFIDRALLGKRPTRIAILGIPDCGDPDGNGKESIDMTREEFEEVLDSEVVVFWTERKFSLRSGLNYVVCVCGRFTAKKKE